MKCFQYVTASRPERASCVAETSRKHRCRKTSRSESYARTPMSDEHAAAMAGSLVYLLAMLMRQQKDRSGLCCEGMYISRLKTKHHSLHTRPNPSKPKGIARRAQYRATSPDRQVWRRMYKKKRNSNSVGEGGYIYPFPSDLRPFIPSPSPLS